MKSQICDQTNLSLYNNSMSINFCLCLQMKPKRGASFEMPKMYFLVSACLMGKQTCLGNEFHTALTRVTIQPYKITETFPEESIGELIWLQPKPDHDTLVLGSRGQTSQHGLICSIRHSKYMRGQRLLLMALILLRHLQMDLSQNISTIIHLYMFSSI